MNKPNILTYKNNNHHFDNIFKYKNNAISLQKSIKNIIFWIKMKITNRFNRYWLLLSAIVFGTILFAILSTFDMTKPVSLIQFAFIFISGAVILFTLSIKIEITLFPNEVHYKVFPVHSKAIIVKKEDIRQIEIKKINTFKDFGGIGIRYRGAYTAYLTTSNTVLDIQYKYKKVMLDIGNIPVEDIEFFLINNGYKKIAT